MEEKEEIGHEQDACSVALEAAASVLNEQCGSGAESEEPEDGRYLRLDIKANIRRVRQYVIGTMPGDPDKWSKYTILQIDKGIEHNLISEEFGDILKRAVEKARKGEPYNEVFKGIIA